MNGFQVGYPVAPGPSNYAAPGPTQQLYSAGLAPPPTTPTRFANPNVGNHPHVFMAVYSGTPVYEMTARGIGVMKRRSDSYMNATQILKVAGIDKGKRTRILERDIIQAGPYEKVQGGYGRFQGTWIPFERARELAHQYGVAQILAPIFDFQSMPATAPNGDLMYPAQQGVGRTTADVRPSPSSVPQKRDRDIELDLQDGKRMRIDPPPDVPSRPLRESSPPARRVGSIGDDPTKAERYRQILQSIFVHEVPPNAVVDLAAQFPPDMDVDAPIDDHLHTALHWASALARMALIKPLLACGANMNRGNDVGETPLVRAVLATNHHDLDTFGMLLDVLAPSIRTVDHLNRTIFHHITLIAGVKGRTASASYYLSGVLEYIACKEDGDFRELINAQDKNGDTALNIAARVGSKSLVKMLLEAGADRSTANKLGLRPVDFGLDDNTVLDGSDVIANLKTSGNGATPSQKVQDIIASLNTLISGLGADFQKELVSKGDAIDRTQGQLQEATKELAEVRQQIAYWRTQVSQRQHAAQRVANLERLLAQDLAFDWTGRTEIDGSPTRDPAFDLSFAYRDPLPSDGSGSPPALPTANTPEALVTLRRLVGWYQRILLLLRQRLGRTKESSAELEARYRKLLATFTGLQEGQVDGMLEQLLQAVESDGQDVELGRVSNFLNRVKTSQ